MDEKSFRKTFEKAMAESQHIVASEGLISQMRSKVYASFFGSHNPVSTPAGFYEILGGVPNGSSILDVGCGDGLYYTDKRIVELIQKKSLNILSIDVDAGAVPIAKERIERACLSSLVKAECKDLLSLELSPEQPKYDIVLFMESFPVIDRPLMSDLVAKARSLGKQIQLYHNLVDNKNWFLSWLKPRIKYFTLVDFGALTSVKEQEEIISGWGVKKFRIEPLLTCKYGQMSLAFNFIPVIRNWMITQYLVTLES